MIDLLEYLVAMWLGAAIGFVAAAIFVVGHE